ncbi:hypothetical protein T492DRAFT_1100303 [Pavlovales sp. CCMP2436]|nr:hypothetical protein T492DRAFT_1100303 [Pavlovales sp. CCMP2436]|mmetsp:Transcript_38855/g.96058  ORF Transcript_38855/g.96058 Transcript_38855/m.96058 type:complete len:517 (+) Transcript_38855:140-1690(+)
MQDLEAKSPSRKMSSPRYDEDNPPASVRFDGESDEETLRIEPLNFPRYHGDTERDSTVSVRGSSVDGGETDRARKFAFPQRALPWTAIYLDGRRESILDRTVVRLMTGVEPRDIRVTDPTLGYPPSIMIRERALVINLEHVKAIITAEVMLVQELEAHPLFRTFIENLMRRLFIHRSGASSDEKTLMPEKKQAGQGAPPAVAPAVPAKASSVVSNESFRRRPSSGIPNIPSIALGSMGGSVGGNGKRHHIQPPTPGLHLQMNAMNSTLPFDVRALEGCLQEVINELCSAVDALVKSAVPVFDRLVGSVDKELLEAARWAKTALMRLSTRVDAVRAILEYLLDSQSSIADMCLSRKHAVGSALHVEHAVDNAADLLDRRASRGGLGTDDRSALDDMENMLETYFEQIDGGSKKLGELRDYVMNTEDYVQIELDSHRNSLIRLDLVMTTATLCISAFSLIGSLFGMNIHFWSDDYPDLADDGLPGPLTFKVVVLGSLVGCIGSFVLIMSYARKKKLLL